MDDVIALNDHSRGIAYENLDKAVASQQITEEQCAQFLFFRLLYHLFPFVE